MNCPDCHCPRGEPLTVAANSLVTRCHNAFHAVAVSPARPDDFATETAKDTAPPPPSHHGAAEAFVGDLQKSTESTEAARDLPDPQTYKRSDTTLEFPYSTPIPTAHDGSTGWVWCATCESPQPVSGHECGPALKTMADMTVVELLAAARDVAAATNQPKAHDAIATLLLALGVP